MIRFLRPPPEQVHTHTHDLDRAKEKRTKRVNMGSLFSALSAGLRYVPHRLLLLDPQKRTLPRSRLLQEEQQLLGQLLIAAVAGVVLLSYKLCDPRSSALRCYARQRDKGAYLAMSSCLLIAGAGVALGAQAVLVSLTRAGQSHIMRMK